MRNFINPTLAFFILMFSSHAAQAQLIPADSSYQFHFQGDSLLEAIQQIERETPYRFYLDNKWLNGIVIDKDIKANSLEEVISSLLADTRLHFAIVENKVILTNNSPIIAELKKEHATSTPYLFEREYQSGSSNKVVVIGDKTAMVTGGESLIVGFIKEKDSKAPIGGAIVFVEGSTQVAISDPGGFFSIKAPNGKGELSFTFSGMKPETRSIILFSDGELNVELEPESILLEEVSVTANRDANITNVTMGVANLNMEELKTAPKMLGENDLIQVALTLPGVQNIGEGSAGFNVRGGKTDQNLVLFNHAPVYNPFHFFGFFSSFNADLMGQTDLYKSNIPVNKSGRLSSLLDVTLKEGNKEKLTVTGGLNPVTSRLTVEVPLVKGKTSLIAGGRSSYSDWVLRNVGNENIRNSEPFFFDLAAGIHHSYGNNSSLEVSSYYSNDRFRLSPDSLFSYYNLTGSARWLHFFSPKIASEVVATTSGYEYEVAFDKRPEIGFNYGFRVNDHFGQVSVNYYPSDQHELRLGIDSRFYDLSPGFINPLNDSSEVSTTKLERETGMESSAFLSDNFKVNEKLSLDAGIRYSIFRAFGGRTVQLYEPNMPRSANSVISSVSYKSREVMQTYQGMELRMGFKYSLSPSASVKGSISNSRQYIFALSENVSISPTATWKLADPNFKPQLAQQVAIGYFKNFNQNSFETSVEAYYKRFNNTLDYKIGADLILNPTLEQDVIEGIGRAYGVEMLVKKNTGKWRGWVSYTYSRSEEQYKSAFLEETINNGSYYPTNYEKPHYFSLVSTYKYTRRYSFSFNLHYSSGRPVTYPTAKYTLGGTEIVHFADRNSYRIPDYFRVDVSLNMEGNHKIKKLAHGFWSFSIYNLTGRKNVYSVFFQNTEGRIQGYQLSVLGDVIPSITYNFKF